MGNAAQFAEELNAFGIKIETDAVALKREVGLAVVRAVGRPTPVGQPSYWKRPAPKGYVGGYHRGQWQTTSGEPAAGQVGLRSLEAVVSEAEQVKVDLERTTWVTNNGPGIGKLEFKGHSPQARDGWVRAAVERVRARYAAGAAGG